MDLVSNLIVDKDLFDSHIASEIKDNYVFNLFYLLPGIDSRVSQIHRNAKRLNMSSDEIEKFQNALIASGLWAQSEDNISMKLDLLDFGELTIQDFLAHTISVISKISEEKRSEYDSMSLVTSRVHIKKFIKTVNLALKELYESSKEDLDDRNCLFSWTHMGVIELESKSKAQYWRKNEKD